LVMPPPLSLLHQPPALLLLASRRSSCGGVLRPGRVEHGGWASGE
jgi:hypothetical protein